MKYYNQRGFTLIELLIALMLAAVVATSLVTVSKSMTETAKSQQMAVEASMAARSGLDMLRLDFMRVGMFVAANPRNDENKESMVSKGTGGNVQAGYYRNPIVHLNPPTGTNNGEGMDSVVLVGNFIGNSAYEAEIDMDTADTITITSGIRKGMCDTEFNPKYAFVHIITGTGQTHEAKIESVSESDCNNGICKCEITTVSGELIAGAFGERNVKVAANQAVLYKVETIASEDRKVLMRYFIDYDGSSTPGDNCDVTATDDWVDETTATVIAENVVDFQVWFRTISSASVAGDVDLANYQTTTVLGTNGKGIPDSADVIIGDSYPSEAATKLHLSCPGGNNVFEPQNVRSAIISLAVRSERTDRSLRIDTDSSSPAVSSLVSDEVAAPDASIKDVGYYRIRRYNLEIATPNLMSQMADGQFSGTAVF